MAAKDRAEDGKAPEVAAAVVADAPAPADRFDLLKQKFAAVQAEMAAAGFTPSQIEAGGPTGGKSYLVKPRSVPAKGVQIAPAKIDGVCDESEAARVFYEKYGITETHYYAVDVIAA